MIKVEVEMDAAHPPEAAIVFVTVYVPGEDNDKVIIPVVAAIDAPEGDEVNVPAVPPPL